mgnify:FL=1
MDKLILIKYGELTTKKDNRKFFIKELVNNIRKKIDDIEIEYSLDRMYIKNNNIDDTISKLKEVFGIYSIIECYKVNTNIDEIKDTILNLLKNRNFKTFKVVTKRSDKSFPISSMEFSSKIGGIILKNIESKVDVHNPDIYVNIEIKNGYTYIYTNEIKGLGGYPVGVQGKGLLMLSGGIDSPVAGYLALKRGIDVECIYFDSPPHTSIEAKNKVIDLANILNKYSGKIKIFVVPFTKLQETIYKNVQNEYMITIMRRMMYRIAHKLALKNKCKVIINGESIGQVASQTLTSINTINSVTNFPIIRPVCCLDKLEIIEISKKIGTYDISIRPYEDCCTVFVPKHPSINPDINKCLEFEKNFDYETLIDEAINNVQVIYKLDRNKHSDLL